MADSAAGLIAAAPTEPGQRRLWLGVRAQGACPRRPTVTATGRPGRTKGPPRQFGAGDLVDLAASLPLAPVVRGLA